MREGHHIGRMSSLLGGLMAISLVLPVAMGTANAQQSQPSSKVTAKTANLTLLPKTTGTGDWQTLLSNTIKTSNMKDLFITASFEVGLFTQTLVSSKNMVKDTSTADANVQVRVMLDGKVVEPGQVVYGRRTQTLSATLDQPGWVPEHCARSSLRDTRDHRVDSRLDGRRLVQLRGGECACRRPYDQRAIADRHHRQRTDRLVYSTRNGG